MDTDIDLQATIERARGFEPDAWEELYRRLYPRLHAYARRRLSAPHCDDAVNEAFARAMEGIDRFKWRGGGFDGWMFGILRNVVLETIRKIPRSSAYDGDVADKPSDEAGPLEQVISVESTSDVRRAFSKLSDEDRELLELRVLGRLDAKAVGAIVGKRAGAVRMAQARALDRLGELLREPAR